MVNKVLIKLIVPEIDNEFDLFIPVNEVIWKIKKLMIKAISGMNVSYLNEKKDYILFNKNTSREYLNNDVVINTDIRNATELILISKSN